MAATTGLIGAGGAIGLGTIFSGLNTIFSLVGQARQQQTIRGQAEHDAAVARNNQIIAERAAADVRERGEVSASLRRRQISQLIGVQRASFAAHGVELVPGDTSTAILADTAAVGALEVANIEANAERTALEFETRGINFGTEAERALFRAESTSSLPLIATALSGASEISRRFRFNPVLSNRIR